MDSENIIKKVAEVAATTNTEVFAVGGFVRDKIMARASKDIDFVVMGSGIAFYQKLKEQFKEDEIEKHVEFENFDTARLAVYGITLEFAGARKEKYDHASRKPVVTNVGTLEDDLVRRDFTVNAIAMRIDKKNYGTFVDPFGGIIDISKKILKTPDNADETFSEDPLRILRAARFASQLDFQIEQETMAAIKNNVARLEIISAERIKEEMDKLLGTNIPSVGLSIMYDTGIMEFVLPELCGLWGVEFVGDKGHKNQLLHTFKVTDRAAANTQEVWLRWSALLHDIGKAPTKRFDEKIGWTFHGHDVVGARMFVKIAKRLRFDKNSAKFISKMIRWHLRPIALCDEGITDSAVRRLIVNMGDDLESLIILYRADLTTKNEKKILEREKNFAFLMSKIEEVREKDKMRAFQSPVRGDEIMQILGLKPGKDVGKYKKAIEEAIIEGKIPNEHDAAREYLLKIKNVVK